MFLAETDRILLKDVLSITLYRGLPTASRKRTPLPQLKCIGGEAGCKGYTPSVVHVCYQ